VVEEFVGSDASTAAHDVSYVWHPQYVDALALRYWDSDNSGSPDALHYYLQDANFGVDADQLSDVENVYLYTGREYDRETGLQHSRYRYYAPHLGRFLNRDPIGYLGGANLYEYVDGRPTVSLHSLGMANLWNPISWRVSNPSQRWRGFVNPLSSTLHAAGIPLLEAIESLVQQQPGSFKQSMLVLRDRAAAGDSLAAAMRVQPDVFDLSVHMVEVGENSGTLDASKGPLHPREANCD
jgi:RHS repeat-associated protein